MIKCLDCKEEIIDGEFKEERWEGYVCKPCMLEQEVKDHDDFRSYEELVRS